MGSCLSFLESSVTMLSFAISACMATIVGIVLASLTSVAAGTAVSVIMFLLALGFIVCIIVGFLSIKFNWSDPLKKMRTSHVSN